MNFATILLIPLLFGCAEFCDIQAARQMDTLAVMLACRAAGLAILVPVVVRYGAPQFTTAGVGWAILNAVYVAAIAPIYLAAARQLNGAALSGIGGAYPFVVALLCWAIRAETPRPLHLACIGLIVVSTYGLSR